MRKPWQGLREPAGALPSPASRTCRAGSGIRGAAHSRRGWNFRNLAFVSFPKLDLSWVFFCKLLGGERPRLSGPGLGRGPALPGGRSFPDGAGGPGGGGPRKPWRCPPGCTPGSMVDTFYAIGLVMRLCQSISLLELLHIYVGIEPNHLFPRFLQLTERIIILFVVITSQEEVQEKYVVCVLFIFWNLLDMVRYTYSMLSVIGISYAILTWLSQTLWMPIYPLCVLAEAFAIYQSLPYFESFGTYSTKLPFDLSIYFPYVLKIYLMMLFIGMYYTYSHLYSERRDILRVFPFKKKKM
ncbi:very-long-chain (3R)-3-hydroxyacyl-CoA dehydratase 4 isoform X1 [Callorhinus ursinus]|uniref:very-long-chain (3R)-3-hydroxyacyl-CoA dehydratase 4 isoform X1 n=1 Tax=Callorhinus ursinus TaxID=34884 RepID=UPI003CD0498C